MPWDKGFYLSCIGVQLNLDEEVIWFDHNQHMPTPLATDIIQNYIELADIVIAHNMKYDLNVLRYWLDIKFNGKPLYCTMIGEYILSGQNTRNYRFNLNACCKRNGLEPKLDKVREHWDAGIDTCDIPPEILSEYVMDDVYKAHDLYLIQSQSIEELELGQIIRLQNEFTYSLSDMECNGFKFDLKRSDQIVKETKEEINKIETELYTIIEGCLDDGYKAY